jgi:hypothetical protein
VILEGGKRSVVPKLPKPVQSSMTLFLDDTLRLRELANQNPNDLHKSYEIAQLHHLMGTANLSFAHKE